MALGFLAMTTATPPVRSLVVMRIFVKPLHSPTGDRIVGKRQTSARAEILGDPHRRTWEQHDESLEAFEKRVEEEAKALRQRAGPGAR